MEDLIAQEMQALLCHLDILSQPAIVEEYRYCLLQSMMRIVLLSNEAFIVLQEKQ